MNISLKKYRKQSIRLEQFLNAKHLGNLPIKICVVLHPLYIQLAFQIEIRLCRLRALLLDQRQHRIVETVAERQVDLQYLLRNTNLVALRHIQQEYLPCQLLFLEHYLEIRAEAIRFVRAEVEKEAHFAQLFELREAAILVFDEGLRSVLLVHLVIIDLNMLK